VALLRGLLLQVSRGDVGVVSSRLLLVDVLEQAKAVHRGLLLVQVALDYRFAVDHLAFLLLRCCPLSKHEDARRRETVVPSQIIEE
jgi:hypothetical protein